jgi:hypothetical protein
MSFDASTLQFFQDIRLNDGSRTWIEQHLLSDLPSISSGLPWSGEPTGCLLADIGNYFLRVLHILATFARNLLQSNAISDHIDEKLQELVAEDDLHTANQLDDKHAALK